MAITAVLTDTLASYVPALIRRRLAVNPAHLEAPETERVSAAVLFADISGFTRLTEQLAQQGLAGAEKLTDLLNAYFERLITLISAHGGDVVKFAGDAQLALWTTLALQEDLPTLTLRAAHCALAVQDQLHDCEVAPGIRLSMKIGVGAGDVVTMHLGGLLGRWELLLAGAPLVQVGIAEGRARPGEVILSPQAWALSRAQVMGTPLEYGGLRLESVLRPPSSRPAPPAPVTPAAEGALQAYLPGAIRSRLVAGQTGWLAELRRVSVLFVHLPDMNHEAPDALRQMQDIMHVLQSSLYRYEGSINKLSVDEKGLTLVAALGLPPLAHEDDAARAVQAALALREGLRGRGIRHGIGVTTGRVYCGEIGSSGRREYTLIGQVVNRAARLMMAAGDDILCDEPTRHDAQGRFVFAALPAVTLKGMAEPVPVFRPCGEAPCAPCRRPLLGRDSERARMADHLHALDQGGGRCVLIEGEAGIGKSRLLADLVEQAQCRGFLCLVGSSDAIEKTTPYHAWRPIVARLLDLDPRADPAVRRARVLSRLASSADLLARAPLLNSILPLDLPENDLTREMHGQVRADNTCELVARLLQAEVARQRTLVVIEDAHWLDSASWAVTVLASRVVHPLLLVIAMRPLTESIPAEYCELAQSAGLDRLVLDTLPPDVTRAFVCQRLGVTAVPDVVAELIVNKTQGNPFFSEELALALQDAGLIVVEGDRCREAPQVDWKAITLPDSVQGAITSRMDRLSPALQLTLKVASVIGRVFALRILRDVYPLQEERAFVADHVASLERLDFTRLATPEPNLAYLFKHVIGQEVAYNLMLFAQRRQLHRDVAHWYEQGCAADLSSYYPLLAYHWRGAGDITKAVDYLEKAGEQALQRGAYLETVEFFQSAMALEGPPPAASSFRRARWERHLGEAYLGLGHLAESRQHLERAGALLGYPAPRTRWGVAAGLAREFVGQAVNLLQSPRSNRRAPRACPRLLEGARAYERLVEIHYLAAETGRLLHAILRTGNLAEAAGPSPELARAYAALCAAAGLVPLHALAEAYARRARTTADQLGQLSARGWVLEVTSIYGVGVGHWPQMRAALATAIEIFDRLGDRSHKGQCLAILAQAAHFQGDVARGVQLWAEVAATARSHGNRLHQAWGLNGQAQGALWLGQETAETSAQLEQALAIFAEDIDRISETTTHGLLALSRWRRGEPELARKAAAAGARLIAQSGRPNGYYALEGYSGVAEVYLALWEAGDPAMAAPARQACAALCRYAQVFPIGRPRAQLWQGLAHQLAGHPARSRRAWRRALKAAQALDMPYEQGLACYQLGRHLPQGQSEREGALSQAQALFTRLGAAYHLRRLDALEARHHANNVS
jgi:class 3 adenylate cyclase/tetratricopeptide (TPR) repeat protein